MAILALVLFVLYNSVTIAGGDEIITLERKYFGKHMPDGRTVALSDEVGMQARVLGPGVHWLIPFIYSTKKHKFLVIPKNKVGVVRAITGAPIPSGSFMAKAVDCDLFQDGEKFLKNGGEKGAQLAILPEGEYKINPHLFQVVEEDAILVEDNEVAVIESIAGQQVKRSGGNFGSPVECDNFQNAQMFLENGGQKGPQIAFLTPGIYRINTILFSVVKKPITVIPGGMMGLVEATDGAQISAGRLLAKEVDGHNNFFDGEAFIKNGGEKGRQLQVLKPGTYRLNPLLFRVVEKVEWTHIDSNQVGIVTVNEGEPVKGEAIAADKVPLADHNSYQDPAKYLAVKGQKGLQQEVLRAGNYIINPWFASVEKTPMTEILIGTCGVVTSFVGEEGEDLTKDDKNVNAKIVANGKKGIWTEPLSPGLHPINTRVCKITIVPTTQILLSWADDTSSAHKFDEGLKTIELLTADAFKVNMDVRVIIHIAMADASKVVANLGSVQNMIAQVLEPAISSHFRNAAQKVQALKLLDERSELQEAAKIHIQGILKSHNIESKDTMIAAIVLPPALTKTVTDRQLAEQEKKTYQTQKEAQFEKRELENATAQANAQADVVKSERDVEIQKNIAAGKVEAATGAKEAAVLDATGKAEARKLSATAEAEAVKVTANANAEATKVNAIADAEAKEKVGLAEAKVILEKGKSTAEAYKLEVGAMGQENFGRINALKEIKDLKLKLVPDVLIVGGGEGGGSIDNFMKLNLLEKVTGKDFLELAKPAGDTTEAPKA
ncbi:MAG: SPFH domain-containing protein [bacterium]